MKLSQIRKNPNNPRIIRDEKFEKLKRSIQDFPQMMELRPIIVDESGVILGGNMRYEAIKSLKMAEFPDEWVKRVDELTDDQKKEFIVKDNVGFGDWDWDVIANEWDELPLDDWGLDVPGFEAVEPLEATEDNFDTTPPTEAKTVLGDLYEIGAHRLLCGDSTNITDVEQLMRGHQAHINVIDPPYDLEHLYRESISLAGKTTTARLLVMWDCKRFATAPQAALDCGWTPQYELIWDCVQSWYTPNRPLQRHKTLGVFGDDPYFDTEKAIIYDGKDRGQKRNVQNTRGGYEYTPLNGAKHISTVEQFPNTQQTDEHGHGKPVQWIVAILAGLEGDLVYDAFCGSGAFMVAAHQLNRKCYGMELDPKYCDVIVKRMKALDSTLVVTRNGEVCEDFNVTN